METIDCPHCGILNDLGAVQHEGCCHDCREDISLTECYRCGYGGVIQSESCPKCGCEETI